MSKGTLVLTKKVDIAQRIAQRDMTNTVITGDLTNRCYVLIGVSCSGKSYWTDSILRHWRNRASPVIICEDDIAQHHTELLSPAEMKRECFRCFHEAIGVHRDIIIDRPNLSFHEREEYLSILPTSYQKIAIVFTVPQALMFARLKDRQMVTGQPYSDIVVKNMLRSFQKPEINEFDRQTDIDHHYVY